MAREKDVLSWVELLSLVVLNVVKKGGECSGKKIKTHEKLYCVNYAISSLLLPLH